MAYKLKIPVLRGGKTIPLGAVIDLDDDDAGAIDCEWTDAPVTHGLDGDALTAGGLIVNDSVRAALFGEEYVADRRRQADALRAAETERLIAEAYAAGKAEAEQVMAKALDGVASPLLPEQAGDGAGSPPSEDAASGDKADAEKSAEKPAAEKPAKSGAAKA